MKKLCIILLVLVACAPAVYFPAPKTSAAGDTYARVKSAGALFYRHDSGENPSDIYFLLREGYYVRILGESASPDRKSAEFDDLRGYVAAADVETVSYVPKYKYGTGTLKIDTPDGSAAVLRSLPDKFSDDLGQIAFGTEGIKFYNLNDAEGTWYFARYGDKRGYIAAVSAAVTAALPAPSDEAIPEPPPGGNGENPEPQPQDDARLWLIVAAIGIPALIILLLIFKPGRRAPPPPPRRVPRYYEE